MAVQDLKRMPQQDVAQGVQDIWAEFLAEGAPSSINLDSHSYERTSQNLKDPSRYSYEDAQVSASLDEKESKNNQILVFLHLKGKEGRKRKKGRKQIDT